MPFPALTIEFPDWLREFPVPVDARTGPIEDRMQLAVDLARRNVREGTGGPFGAAVFDPDGRLVSYAVNLVTFSGLSAAHAEVLALSLAHRETGLLDLGAKERYQLVTTAAPCWMCLGAIHWSGITDLVCGARDEDVRSIGFDEGHKPDEWAGMLRQRGIRVMEDVCRAAAVEILRQYADQGGPIYNSGSADPG
jgi:tRNA(Arg) A34 adenosine deaminase TadA